MICIIPARGGSQRIPGKNIKDFYGIPMIAYSIMLAKDADIFDSVVVSSDDEEILKTAEGFGAVRHERPSQYAIDYVGTQAVAAECLMGLDMLPRFVCVLYATAPLLTEFHIRMGAATLMMGQEMVYSVDPENKPSGGYFMGKCEHFIEERDPYQIGIPFPTSDIDINTPEDWDLVKALFEERYL